MSAYYYDNALLEKIKKWTDGTNITIVGVNDTHRLFEVVADQAQDSPIKLPLIAITRSGGYTILNKQKQPKTFNGLVVGKSEKATITLNVVPIELEYQIDIYARYFQEADEYARNFVFNIINYPHLSVEIPYESVDLKHYSNIRISSEVEDNSDIPQRFIPGEFSRFSIRINIDDAYLFDVRVRDNWHICQIIQQADDDKIMRTLVYTDEPHEDDL